MRLYHAYLLYIHTSTYELSLPHTPTSSSFAPIPLNCRLSPIPILIPPPLPETHTHFPSLESMDPLTLTLLILLILIFILSALLLTCRYLHIGLPSLNSRSRQKAPLFRHPPPSSSSLKGNAAERWGDDVELRGSSSGDRWLVESSKGDGRRSSKMAGHYPRKGNGNGVGVTFTMADFEHGGGGGEWSRFEGQQRGADLGVV